MPLSLSFFPPPSPLDVPVLFPLFYCYRAKKLPASLSRASRPSSFSLSIFFFFSRLLHPSATAIVHCAGREEENSLLRSIHYSSETHTDQRTQWNTPSSTTTTHTHKKEAAECKRLLSLFAMTVEHACRSLLYVILISRFFLLLLLLLCLSANT